MFRRAVSILVGGGTLDEGGSSLPVAVARAYGVLLGFIDDVGKFPRSDRVVLGERIRLRMLSALEFLALAMCARDRGGGEYLRQVQGDVQALPLIDSVTGPAPVRIAAKVGDGPVLS